jgi:hypothetical protein
MTLGDLEARLQSGTRLPLSLLPRYERFRTAISAKPGTPTIYAIRKDRKAAEKAWSAAE